MAKVSKLLVSLTVLNAQEAFYLTCYGRAFTKSLICIYKYLLFVHVTFSVNNLSNLGTNPPM